ncbi:16S rRNA (uracil(1498)-N(3))-methyltransferase [Ralstonia pickettii]|nr:16S rRNA (uracil(1498)-N(3))-methyltransferase [Ralstonia pickettii]
MNKLQRYFIQSQENWQGSHVKIDGDDVHHISRVMRNKPGDKLICNDMNGHAALCTITEIANDQVLAVVEEWLEQETELPIEVTIVQGLPKGDKLDLIVQKGTELGATTFIPFRAERSIVNWDEKKKHKKIQRLEKIVKEASEQSHRRRMPTVQAPVSLNELLKLSLDYDYNIFAYEEEARTRSFQSLANILKEVKAGKRLLICIGPEGGFTEKEVKILKENHFTPVRFGPRILRTETAALYALSSISYHFEELRWQK